jgi:hypothetical protein
VSGEDISHELRNHKEECLDGVHWTFCQDPEMWERTQDVSGGCRDPEKCELKMRNEHSKRFHIQTCDGETHSFDVCMEASDGACSESIKVVSCSKDCSLFAG